MRTLLRLFIKVIATAGWLSLCAVAQAKAQSWQVVVQPWQDSLMTQVDTTMESAFCGSATIDKATHTITMEQVIVASYAKAFDNEEGVGIHFACPTGAILIHVHLARHGAPHGPSQPDLRVYQHLPHLPPAGIIVYLKDRGVAEYIAYGVQ